MQSCFEVQTSNKWLGDKEVRVVMRLGSSRPSRSTNVGLGQTGSNGVVWLLAWQLYNFCTVNCTSALITDTCVYHAKTYSPGEARDWTFTDEVLEACTPGLVSRILEV